MVNLPKKCTKVQAAYPRIYNKVQVKTWSLNNKNQKASIGGQGQSKEKIDLQNSNDQKMNFSNKGNIPYKLSSAFMFTLFLFLLWARIGARRNMDIFILTHGWAMKFLQLTRNFVRIIIFGIFMFFRRQILETILWPRSIHTCLGETLPYCCPHVFGLQSNQPLLPREKAKKKISRC